MSRDELTLFSYEILGLVGRTGAGTHDLRVMARRGRMLDWAGESQYYVEPKRLARLGYLDARKEPGKTRERTFYTLTDKGREALRRWLLEPPSMPRIQNEAVAKLLAGDILGDDEQLAATLLTLRDQIEVQQAKLERARPRIDELPHRRPYLLLVHELGNRLLQVQREWLDDVERELRKRT